MAINSFLFSFFFFDLKQLDVMLLFLFQIVEGVIRFKVNEIRFVGYVKNIKGYCPSDPNSSKTILNRHVHFTCFCPNFGEQ